MYYPRIEMIDPKDITGLSSLYVPPSGHIAGVFAYKDEKEGIHKVAANIFIKGIVGLEKIVNKKEYEIVYPWGINGFKRIPGRGIKIWGARTLSSEISWRYINVRRTFVMIQEALKEGTSWAVFEHNQPDLRKDIVRHVTAFLIDLWREGYLHGNIPEKAFSVRCDDELNPPENIEKGIITVEVGVAIAKPAEFLIIKLMGNLENAMVLVENE
jgi:phage tail sheath protein FI